MISRLRRLSIGAAIWLFTLFGLSLVLNAAVANAAPGERVIVTTNPVSSITNDADLQNVGDDVITLKQGANVVGTQKVKPALVGGKLTYTATFDPVAPGNYSVCSEKATSCADFQKAAGADSPVTIAGKNPPIAPQGQAEEKTCSTGTGLAGALAWIICPLGQLMIDTTSFVERNLILPYLTVSPLQTGDNPVYRLWESMRNIANVLFIVAFFVVIFSQATSIGLSNYGIKRLLPRIALVAIGTNLSFFIVAFAIDAFNVFGAGISELVLTAITAGGGGGGGGQASGWSIFAISSVGVAGLAIAAYFSVLGAALGWIIWLIGIAFLIILVGVVVLILRQMIIILLVIVSPLAIVAWLLPNTEKYFTKWRGMLIQLLMMYPLIVLLFASGKIVQAIIISGDFDLAASFAVTSFLLTPLSFVGQASSQGTGSAEDIAEAVKVFVGFFAGALPLVLLPATFAFSGSLMGRMYGAMQSRSRDWSKKGYEKASERFKPRIDEWRQLMRQKELKGGVFRRTGTRALHGLGGKRKMLREEERANRQRNYEEKRREWLAEQGQTNQGYIERSAGIGGEEGKRRVMARGVAEVEKAEKENLEAEAALLTSQLRRLQIDRKTFAGGKLRAYLENPTANHTFTAPSGEKFDFRQHPELMRAALYSAAEQGEVGTVQQARLASGAVAGTTTENFQQIVDQAIRANDPTMKGKGGYHLATNFSLAAGRSFSDPTTIVTIDGKPTAIPQTPANNDVVQMQAQAIAAMAQSGAESIAGMKAGHLGVTANSLTDPAQRQAILDAVDALGAREGKDFREMLRTRTTEAYANDNTRNRSEAPDAIKTIRDNI